MSDYSSLYKICVIGPSGVGKSCLLNRLCEKKFTESTASTIGCDFFTYLTDVTLDSGQTFCVKLQIWDTAGQERFRSVISQQFRGSLAAILMFDLNDPLSIDNSKLFMDDLQRYNIPRIIVVGNKCDLPKNVSDQQIAWFKDNDPSITYVSTSAKTAENVEECFQAIAKDLAEGQASGELQCDKDADSFTLSGSGPGNTINEERTQGRKCCGGTG